MRDNETTPMATVTAATTAATPPTTINNNSNNPQPPMQLHPHPIGGRHDQCTGAANTEKRRLTAPPCTESLAPTEIKLQPGRATALNWIEAIITIAIFI